MPFSTAIDNSILDHFVTKATWAARTANATWIGLSSTTPTKAGGNVTEPSTGDGYARVQVTAAEFDAAASSANTTNAEQAFPQATANWLSAVNLTHMVFFDAATAGTFLGFKALTVAKPVLNGDTAKVPAGDLDISIGGS